MKRPTGQLVEKVQTLVTRRQVAPAMRTAISRVTGIIPPSDPTVAVLCAQWALETGNGMKMYNFNVGNVKATSSWTGLWMMMSCNEYVEKEYEEVVDGEVVKKTKLVLEWFYPPHHQTWFRAYETLEDGLEDYVRLLSKKTRFAKAWQEALAGDPYDFVTEAKRAGYFTADLGKYRSAVVDLFGTFLKILAEPEPEVDLPDGPDDEHSTLTDDDLELTEHWLPMPIDWEALRRERDATIRDLYGDDENGR